ncbi:MAG: alanine:cation symporter family protein, partial [Planctomycetaceae bacterium]|nr:alanine:cation symporter family protein [Planctomycetaceae bacterium]
FLGMTSKMVECTLGQMYRHTRHDGHIMGGAMYYLSQGLADIGLKPLGKVLSLLFCVLCIGASFGGGNAFQVNQSYNGVVHTFPYLANHSWLYGLIMVTLAAIVILGGIKRIAGTADKLVPAMCVIYIIAAIWILVTNAHQVPAAFGSIISGAFSPDAIKGGIIGVIVTGFQRAAFSNEAGIGSAAIAHSAAKTDYPVSEGLVALLEPFIDTIVICTMTALVIVITGAWNNPAYADYVSSQNGAGLTSAAMGEHISFFPYVLSLSVFLFAFSTIISWSYYGERCWAYLFGDNSSIVYKILFLICTFLGAVVSPKNILDLSDLAILSMAFPNMLGLFLLHGKVRRALLDYWKLYKAGELDRKPEG